jgi:dTDP-4-amino-4,6-dideoxygalactose transaminase
MKRIPFLTPRFTDPSVVARDYREIFEAGVFSNSGPFEARFAAELERWIGHDVGVAVTANATVGIQLACKTLFHRDRRTVPVASFTAPAVPLALIWSGFEPVLIDIEPQTWQPDLGMTERYLQREGDKVAGILLTSTFGTANAAIDAWEALAMRYRVPLVIDSAAGFASEYPWGEPLGARGNCEIFSFHATKTMAIGEGGAVVSRDHGFIQQINQLKNFGFDDKRISRGLGQNGKLPELAAAMGIRQLDAFKDRLTKRREVLRWYMNGLEPLGCAFQSEGALGVPAFVSVALPSQRHREQLGVELDEVKVGWRAYFDPPIHGHPAFAELQRAGDLAVTDDLSGRIISLPLDEWLTPADVGRIVSAVGCVVGD